MPTFELRQCLGAMETAPITLVPDGFAVSATNVELSPFGAMLPRVGTSKFGLSSGPTAEIDDLFTERTGTSEALWAFSGFHTASYAAHRFNGSTWSSVTYDDSPAYNGLDQVNVACAAYNGKVFLAYNSNVNRLHVWNGTSVRRVGVLASAAPTVANTGAGAYAAVLRYYKVRFFVVESSRVVAVSEMSPSVSFTPSGAGTAARVTKPANPDTNVTHWLVYGSDDNVTYYALSSLTGVGTTTYDDSQAVSTYKTGAVSLEAGFFLPPPSCKFLATNGERLFMAGAYETTAGTGETTPSPRRVWFTRIIGVTEQADDESITSLEDAKAWVDIDSDDGSPITAMVSTFNGAIYVFTKSSVWQLSDTGNVDSPVRADRVASGVGVTSGKLVAADTTAQDGTIYFSSPTGPYRYSPSMGLQYLGADVYTMVATSGSLQKWSIQAVGFDPATRRVYWLYGDDTSGHYAKARVLDPSLLQNIASEWRGGWSRDDWSASYANRLRAVTVYDNKLHIGGADSGAFIFSRAQTATTDDSVAFTSTMTTRTYVLGDGTANFRTEEPYIWKPKGLAVTVAYAVNYGGTSFTFQDTAGTEAVGSEATYHRQKVEGLVAADAFCLGVTLSVTTPVVTADRHMDGVERLVIPVIPMERG